MTKVEGGFGKAKEYASKALSIDNDLAEAHTTTAFIRIVGEYDPKGAEAEFKQAIRLNPNYATAHQWYALLLSYLGRKAEAMVEVRKALDIDPLSPVINDNLGVAFYLMGDLRAAVNQYRRVLEISPSFFNAYVGMIWPSLQAGRVRRSKTSGRRILEERKADTYQDA